MDELFFEPKEIEKIGANTENLADIFINGVHVLDQDGDPNDPKHRSIVASSVFSAIGYLAGHLSAKYSTYHGFKEKDSVLKRLYIVIDKNYEEAIKHFTQKNKE